jgi:molybdopterin-guanine dinucleotide biosynthesis protein A
MKTLFSAVVLAAGHSTRMGREKALLEVGGVPLWKRQRDVLAAAGATEIFLSVRAEQAWARNAPGFDALLHDAFPNCGPIAGLTAGLERASHPLLAVLAIDLPHMTAAGFSTLLAEAEPGIGIVGRRNGFFEPLAAIYPREMLSLAWEAIARADYSLQRLIVGAVAQGVLRVREIQDEETVLFANWNRESDRP